MIIGLLTFSIIGVIAFVFMFLMWKVQRDYAKALEMVAENAIKRATEKMTQLRHLSELCRRADLCTTSSGHWDAFAKIPEYIKEISF